MTQIFVNKLKGFIPAIDRRQSVERFVMEGENFLVNARGPYSTFGSRIVVYNRLVDPQYAQTFRIGTVIIFATSQGFYSYDDVVQQYFYNYILDTPATEEYPWSMAFVGNKYYFVKKGTNLIEYDPWTETWRNDIAFVPTNPHSVSTAGGRLTVVGESVMAWSEIDNGANLNPGEIDKGIGFQSLGIIGGGDVLGIFSVTSGVLTFTKNGVLRSELFQAGNLLTFRHYPLETRLQALNPYSIKNISLDEVIFLAKTGLYRTNGGEPESYQPLMSEYLRDKILPSFNQLLEDPTLIRLSYDSDKFLLFLSIAESTIPYNYNKAFVLYIPLDEWGIFNKTHTGFGEVDLTLETDEAYNFGYFAPNGFLHYFDRQAHVEVFDSNVTGTVLPHDYMFFVKEPGELISRYYNDIAIMSTEIHMTTTDENNFVLGSGLYEVVDKVTTESPLSTTEDWTPANEAGSPIIFTTNMSIATRLSERIWKSYTKIYDGLNSYIDVGLFRITNEEENNVFSAMQNLIISAEEGSSESIVDWELIDPEVTIDWELIDEVIVDWGESISDTVDYDITIIGSIDGFNLYKDQQQIPELVEETTKSKHFTCDNNGIYHIIKLEALIEGQSFQIETIDMDLEEAGVFF